MTVATALRRRTEGRFPGKMVVVQEDDMMMAVSAPMRVRHGTRRPIRDNVSYYAVCVVVRACDSGIKIVE